MVSIDGIHVDACSTTDRALPGSTISFNADLRNDHDVPVEVHIVVVIAGEATDYPEIDVPANSTKSQTLHLARVPGNASGEVEAVVQAISAVEDTDPWDTGFR